MNTKVMLRDVGVLVGRVRDAEERVGMLERKKVGVREWLDGYRLGMFQYMRANCVGLRKLH